MNKHTESRKFQPIKQSRPFTNHFRLQVKRAELLWRRREHAKMPATHHIATEAGTYFGTTVPPVVERRERPRDVLERYRSGSTSHRLTSADRFFEIAGRPCFLTEGGTDR
jgi:hypothetical protein